MSYSYNRLYETQFRGNNVIPATHGNVSVYTTGKADIGSITTTNLGIGKNNTSNALDVNGNVNIDGTITVSKDVDFYGNNVSIVPTLNNLNQNGTLFDADGVLSSGNRFQYSVRADDSAYDYYNNFRITAYDGVNEREYFRTEVVSGGVGTGRLSGLITGNLAITGNLSLQGLTSTGGLTATSSQTINFGTNDITSGTANVSNIKIGAAPYTVGNSIVFPNIDGLRRIVLQPVNNNPYQNHSIGVESGETVFLVPDTTKKYQFSFATSSTAKTDVLSLGYNGLTLSRGTLTLPNTSISDNALSANVVLKNASNTFTTLPQSSATPTNSADFTTKTYVDTAIAGSVPTGVALLASANTFTQQNIFNTFCPQTNTDPVVGNSLVRRSWIDSSLNLRAFDASCVHITGNETVAGSKTLTGQLVLTGGFNASTLQNINFGQNSLVAAALRLGTTPYSLLGSIICGQLDTNRKIVLYPLVNNGIENYSLGVSNAAGEFILLIPSDTRKFRFDYGTSATTKSNIMTIEPYKTNLNIGSNDATNQFTIKTSLSIPYKTLFSVSDFEKQVKITNGCALVLNNALGNYSIDVNDTNQDMTFLLPNDTKRFKFSYGTSPTTTEIMTIGSGFTNLNIGGGGAGEQFTIKSGGNTLFTVSDFNKEVRVSNGCDLIVSSDFLFEDATVGTIMRFSTQDGLLLQQSAPFIMRAGTTSDGDYFKIDAVASTIDISGVIQMNFLGDTRLNFYQPLTTTRVGGFYGADMDLSGGIITLTNQMLLKNNMYINALNADAYGVNGNNIAGTNTIQTPYAHFYGVEGTSVFTITLPTITLQDLGNEICFRRVSGTSNISFISSGGQKAYPNGSITGQTTAFVGLTSGTNAFVAFTAMKESGNTTYAWFAHL
jgi:hypothetical protein